MKSNDWYPRVGMVLSLLVYGASACAVENADFVVKDIRLDGLVRVPASTVYGILPIAAGDHVDESRIADSLKKLFATGDFEDVQALRDGDVLVYKFTERASITSIDIKGNKAIDKDSLLKGLKAAGVTTGAVLQRATLDQVRQELLDQYIAQGRYATEIDINTEPRTRNRVAIKIVIREGEEASIRGVHFTGNHAFSAQELRDQLQLKEHHFLSFIKGDDKYSQEKLRGDLERLRSYYLDRGYAAFHVNSTQVTLSPDHKQVYIDINVDEGAIYKVGTVKLVGELPVAEDQLKQLILVKTGQTFSQHMLTSSTELISKRIGDEGYIFADVNGDPQLDDKNHIANITIFVNPQGRAYVRRVTMKGNSKTDDEVIRREMRQFESSVASTDRIDISKQRLERLGFFKTVKIDKQRVPGSTDLVDLSTTVEEQPSGSVGASVGYSQAVGLTLSATVSQNNFFGTGDTVSVGVTRNQISQSANFSFTNPYFTDDGVSRGFNIYSNKTFFSSYSVTAYFTNSVGGNVSFGYPINEIENLSFSFGVDNTEVIEGSMPAQLVADYVNSKGAQAVTQVNTLAWNRSTLNRGMFPDRGTSQSLSLEVTSPMTNVNYYKLTYDGQLFVPIHGPWALHFHSLLGYGNGLFGTSGLPFYKNFFTGGIGSVRGFLDYTAAPRAPQFQAYIDPMTGAVVRDGMPAVIGGNAVVNGTMELILPMPFIKDASSMRATLFLDAGQAFDTTNSPYIVDNPGLSGMRYSVGLGFSWLTPIGPLTFSLAHPYHLQPDDQRQVFQFTIGQGF